MNVTSTPSSGARVALGFALVLGLLLALAGVAWFALRVPAAELAPYRMAIVGLALLGVVALVSLGLAVQRSLSLALANLAGPQGGGPAGTDAAGAGAAGTAGAVAGATAPAAGHGAAVGGLQPSLGSTTRPPGPQANAASAKAIDGGRPSDDELARLHQAVAAMQDQLRSVVRNVRDSTTALSAARAAAAGSAGGGAGGVGIAGSGDADAWAAPPATGGPSAGELVTSAPASASGADEYYTLGRAVEAARRGGEVVSQVVGHLEDITSASRRIVDIVGVIDTIAFQTNLLALNATVEAAHAGAQGGGAAEVAAEVRTLAQRAATAAREIKALIGSALQKVDSGGKLVLESGHTMDAIVTSVQCVTDIVGHIGKVSTQADAVPPELAGPRALVVQQSVQMSVRQLDEMTQQNVALVQKSSATAQSLQEQAERLQKVVAAFKLLQHTQEAAWTAHTTIAGARRSARLGQLPPAPGNQAPPALGKAGDAG